MTEARLIKKNSRTDIGIQLEDEKIKAVPAIGSNLDLRPKTLILPLVNLRMRMRLRDVFSSFKILSSSWLKVVQHYCLVSMAS